MINSYNNFDNGLYSLCSSFLDKETGKYKEVSEINKTRCCLQVNKKQADICRDECYIRYGIDGSEPNAEKYRLCYSSCENAAIFADIVCRRTSDIWGDNNPFIICAKEYGCTDEYDNNKMSPECVKKNKDKLITCCRKKCIPTTTVNCDDHCDVSFEAVYDRRKLNPAWENTYKMKPSPEQRMKDIQNYTPPDKKSLSIIWYIIGIILLILIVFFTYYLIVVRNKKKMS
jgi:hypothetical protein